ncbi:restriction endonuclease subunit S [Candidatus Pelagibacter sp.]|nr:restriction endonuclease subunit S [Candidatus Pelagibacter sp.]
MKIEQIFHIEKPKQAIFNQFVKDESGINFVSSSAKNNGVVAKVKKNNDYVLYKKGSITVPLKGTVLNASLQLEDFYIAHQIAVLTPLEKYKNLTNLQKIYYCQCIRENKYRFNYNRQADRTLELLDIPSPELFPDWVSKPKFIKKKIEVIKELQKNHNQLSRPTFKKSVSITKLFDIEYGVNLELNKCVEDEDGINFVSRTALNNGISAKVKKINNKETIKPNVLTFAAGGSVGETFLQTEEFYSGRDLYILYPKIKMNTFELLAYCFFIKLNNFRFNYNRQANKTLRELYLPDIDCKSMNLNDIFNNQLQQTLNTLDANI